MRIVFSTALLVTSTVTALWASSNFIAIFAMRIVLAPWVAINLVDFYLINNRRYRVAEIVNSHGGVYGSFNFKAIAIYLPGIAVQVPFMAESFFHGPLASIVGDADVSWIVGLAATALTYYVVASKRASRSTRTGAPEARAAGAGLG